MTGVLAGPSLGEEVEVVAKATRRRFPEGSAPDARAKQILALEREVRRWRARAERAEAFGGGVWSSNAGGQMTWASA